MTCPNCEDKYPAIIVYGYCVDENENEYPFDIRIYESGGSLPAWGIEDGDGYEWPTRFCWLCRERFRYASEAYAFEVTYKEALELSKRLYPDMPLDKRKGENNNG